MHRRARVLIWMICLYSTQPLLGQMPFYTDNADVTDQGTLHFESFNEFDGLQSAQFPDVRQNTANFKFNYGLPHGVELDFDVPYLSIYRAPGSQTSAGLGDADMGVKWNFLKAPRPRSRPALSASLYIEFPTGDAAQSLGSGLTDYWLNVIAQEPFSDKTRLNANFGYLFAGNTSTGVLGIQTTRGQVVTGGVSLLHDFNPRITLGAELYGALALDSGLGKDQLQALAGGQYSLNNRVAVTFGLLGGSHIASPRIGGQVGFEVDFPRRHAPAGKQTALDSLSSLPTQRRSPCPVSPNY
ncbi:transporter [Telmatobacter sp. DSM 110680]|uniref:Transporter n=1 Tax=Telmatobacter sp. DSM 110680 TaxID=3036704 RepID=A0AAU7DQ11_9BACT